MAKQIRIGPVNCACPRTTRERYCEEHAPLARRFYDRQRGSSTERGYDGAWERVAECRRHMDCGLCQPCLAEGFVTASAIVDHIIPIHVRPDWRLEIGNTQVICHPCHTRKTSEDTRRYGGRARTNPSREQMENRYCWAGLDLPSTQDITALVLVFRDEDQYTALPFFWVPEEGARQRAHRDRVPYQDWIREGYIEATPGSVIDYDRIRAKINELGKQYDILEIAIDRWNATQLATQLTDDGFEMVAFGQGYASMNWPTKKLEEVILAEKLAHGGNPVLRWMAGNVSIETEAADNWKPSKKKSRERIDGIVALIMGLDRASRQEEFRSVYDKRGPYFITPDTDWGDGRDD